METHLKIIPSCTVHFVCYPLWTVFSYSSKLNWKNKFQKRHCNRKCVLDTKCFTAPRSHEVITVKMAPFQVLDGRVRSQGDGNPVPPPLPQHKPTNERNPAYSISSTTSYNVISHYTFITLKTLTLYIYILYITYI